MSSYFNSLREGDLYEGQELGLLKQIQSVKKNCYKRS